MIVIGSTLGLIFSLLALVKSTDVFLDQSIKIFVYLKFSSFVVGVLVVGFGTSLPELGVAIMAALQGDPALAFSSAVGSNVANISLVFATILCLVPGLLHLQGHHGTSGFLVLVSTLLMVLCYHGEGLSRWDGLILLLLFGAFLIMQLRHRAPESSDLKPQQASQSGLSWLDYAKLLLFLGAVLIASRLVVWCALSIAEALQVTGTYIGLTLVALGSSLPELVASVSAVKKKQIDMVLGNVIGSNIMNSLMVVGTAVFISPLTHIHSELLHRDLPWALLLALMLWFVGWREAWRRMWPRRILGALWLLSYGCYVLWIALQVP